MCFMIENSAEPWLRPPRKSKCFSRFDSFLEIQRNLDFWNLQEEKKLVREMVNITVAD